MYSADPALATTDYRLPPAPDPESSLTGVIYEGYPVDAPYVIHQPDHWLFSGTGVRKGQSFEHLVGVEFDRVNLGYPTPRPIEVLARSPVVCEGRPDYSDTAYYTTSSGAGVFASGTMRWVESMMAGRGGDGTDHHISAAAGRFRHPREHEPAARLRPRASPRAPPGRPGQSVHPHIADGQTMDPQDGQDAKAGIRDVRIRGSRLLLRALQPGEIEEEWQAMVTADPMVIAALPEEAAFKARLRRSGHLEDGWLDLAIDLDGVSIGRIQTFVPSRWTLPPGTFGVGIGLREDARGKGYGREALALLTDWLFEHATAEAVEASTDPANTAMRTVFRKAGWKPVGSLTEPGREWVMYRMTRQEWEDSLQAWCRTATRLPRLTSAAGPP